MHVLSTSRLHLRTLSEDDAPVYLRLVNEPSFLEHIGDRGIRTLDAARAGLRSGMLAQQARLGYALYMVELGDGTPIGMCGLVKREQLADADLGYAYFPAYWGQGYAYEAAAGVLAHAHSVLGMPRLAAIVAPTNPASIALLEKLGFTYEKTIRMHDEDPGTQLYGRTL